MVISDTYCIIGRLMRLVTAMALAMGVLTSCGDSPVSPAGEGLPDDSADAAGMLRIGFRVAAPAGANSRAVDPEGLPGYVAPGYEVGTPLESTIDFKAGRYRIYFFDENDVFITDWKHPAEVHVLAGNEYWLYTFTGVVPEALAGHSDFSVMVLANWPDFPDYHGVSPAGMTIDDVIEAEWAQFRAFDSFELSVADRRLIPFYGLDRCTGVTFTQGETRDLGSVNLLRAVAKVEVTLDDAALPEDIKLEGAPVIRGINPMGYCAPKGSYGAGFDWTTDYVKDLHMPWGVYNHPDAMKNSMEMLPDGANRWIAYLPEFRNKGAGPDYARIEMKLSHLDEPFVLNFAEYDAVTGRPDNENGRLDIRRNDLYRFHVKGDIHEILFKFTVDEWIPGGRTEIDM